MKAYKHSNAPGHGEIEISIEDCLQYVRNYNPEFCRGKTELELIEHLKVSPIHTNLCKYWIEVEL